MHEITCWYCDHQREPNTAPCAYCGEVSRFESTQSEAGNPIREKLIEYFEREGNFHNPYMIRIGCSPEEVREECVKMFDDGILMRHPTNHAIYRLIGQR